MAQPMVTPARLRELLDYEPLTGEFLWKICRNTTLIGKPAGIWSRGYRLISIDRCRTGAHRVALAMINDQWPKGEVDHIDGDPSNNRLSNLRDVEGRLNRQNVRRPRAHSITGILGVSMTHSGKFRATVRHNGKSHYSKSLPTIEEAQAFYLQLKRQLHEGCTL